jgi:TetR/AcrR family transcriptional regulator, ethionamide resistance regulator
MSASASSSKTRTRQTRERSRRKIIEAATELVRERSYAELNVGEIMARAGLGRTIFYRHFDDLAQLILSASREAIEQLYEAQQEMGQARPDEYPEAVRRALSAAVDVYHRHGPLLRAVDEAALADEQLRHDYEVMRKRFDDFAERSLRDVADAGETAPSDFAEAARALNFMNVSYLLDAFGREPRVTPDVAVQTLTEIWEAVIRR